MFSIYGYIIKLKSKKKLKAKKFYPESQIFLKNDSPTKARETDKNQKNLRSFKRDSPSFFNVRYK